jgi:hypothetical protein
MFLVCVSHISDKACIVLHLSIVTLGTVIPAHADADSNLDNKGKRI